MNDQMLALWTKLQAFEIDGDGGAEFSFERRLARENGWTSAYTRRVVAEYRKFLLLARCAGHPITPSDQVDQAWHLHLTYTRSYWDRLCAQVLERPLHHEPTKGGSREDAKFEDWYARTLESYRQIFGEEPPHDIWPEGADRFDPDLRFKRIDSASNYILPKRRVWHFGLFGGVLTMSTVFTGCAFVPSQGIGYGAAAVIFIVLVMVIPIVAIGIAISRGAKATPHRSRRNTGCSTTPPIFFDPTLGSGSDFINPHTHSHHPGHGNTGHCGDAHHSAPTHSGSGHTDGSTSDFGGGHSGSSGCSSSGCSSSGCSSSGCSSSGCSSSGCGSSGCGSSS